MKLTHLFTRTRKEAPADEQAKNAQLLIRAGYIHKEMAGVYTFLPLGKKTLENIMQIIREEMDAIGGNEMSLTALQQKDVWEASGRWSDDVMDVWFRTTLANGTELGLAPTHEEPLTAIMKNFIDSYKDLPSYPYQFQTKFRNELRSKSGLMRGREFVMKDLYSFSKDREEHDAFYEKCAESYKRIFTRLGIGDVTYRTFASGGSFSKFSDEFQTVSPVGEDTIYIHKGKGIALNQEVYTKEVMEDLGITADELIEEKAVEVGNIFTLGTKFSDALELTFNAEDGTKQPVFMGSYGIGPSRLVGLLAEHFADEKGLAWPEEVAPFKVYIAVLGRDDAVLASAQALHDSLEQKGVSVLLDDRDVRPGEKFADADLLGMPHRIVVSGKTTQNNVYEYKHRTAQEVQFKGQEEILQLFA